MECTWKNGKNMESMQKNMDSMKNSWNFPMPVFHANSNGVLKTGKNSIFQCKKTTLILSTFDSFCRTDDSDKMTVTKNYNLYAKAVDRMNQMCQYYRYDHKTRKWWKPVFYQFLEIVMVNSFLLYKEQANSKLSYKDFRLKVVVDLLKDDYYNTKIFNKKPILTHSSVHITGKYGKWCKVCRKSRVSFKCKECSFFYGKDIPLCREDCPLTFHKNPDSYLQKKKKSNNEQKERMEIE